MSRTIPEALNGDARLWHGPEGDEAAPPLGVCRLPVADLHVDDSGEPGPGVGTQIMRGERVHILEEGTGRHQGWLRVASEHDSYLGWVRGVAIDRGDGPRPYGVPSHVVSVPRTFLYPVPDLAKRPPVATLTIGARVSVKRSERVRDTPYAILDDGRSVVERHLARRGTHARDPVAIAERLLGTPYLWGGRTALGVDCSGLVQLTHALCGDRIMRDADQQSLTVGDPVETEFEISGVPKVELRRGDLVFWRGHVGMMADAETMIHASGHAMAVVKEPQAEAVRRIRALYGEPTGVRRPS